MNDSLVLLRLSLQISILYKANTIQQISTKQILQTKPNSIYLITFSVIHNHNLFHFGLLYHLISSQSDTLMCEINNATIFQVRSLLMGFPEDKSLGILTFSICSLFWFLLNKYGEITSAGIVSHLGRMTIVH